MIKFTDHGYKRSSVITGTSYTIERHEQSNEPFS